MTTRWRASRGQYVVGDVVMWGELARVKRGRGRREKTVTAGTRRMTAQVDGVTSAGWVALTVMVCEILSLTWEPIKPFPRGEKIWRKREALDKGEAHRRIGSAEEESARAIVASRHLGPEPVAVPVRRVGTAPASPRGRYRGGRGRGPRTRLRPK